MPKEHNVSDVLGVETHNLHFDLVKKYIEMPEKKAEGFQQN
jgi:hypothetical protein